MSEMFLSCGDEDVSYAQRIALLRKALGASVHPHDLLPVGPATAVCLAGCCAMMFSLSGSLQFNWTPSDANAGDRDASLVAKVPGGRSSQSLAQAVSVILAAAVAAAPTSNPAHGTHPPGSLFRDRLADGSPGPELIVIPPGRFAMGSPVSEAARLDGEGPQHPVSIGKPFALGKYAVTFAEYDRFASATTRAMPVDAGWGRDRRPVIRVSWSDAQAYVAWLSEQTGHRYRLPSEAEWEYAARAGTATPYYWGSEVHTNRANCKDSGSVWSGQQTAPVGSFAPNPFGLYEMLGNVWEWVEDCWHENYTGAPTDGSPWLKDECSLRVLRGGSWNLVPWCIRSASRTLSTPDGWFNSIGFRIARDL